MGLVNSYSKEIKPYLHKPSSNIIFYKKDGAYDNYCAAIVEYKDKLKRLIDEYFEIIKNSKDMMLNDYFEKIDKASGTDFISIDGKSVGVFDRISFSRHVNDLFEKILNGLSEMRLFLIAAPDDIEYINKWLKELDSNYNLYLDAKRNERVAHDKYLNYKALLDEHENVAESDINIAYNSWQNLLEVLNNYKEIPDPSVYGVWVRGA